MSAGVWPASAGRSRASPRSRPGITNGTVSQVERVRSVGNLRSVTPTRRTTSHSRPLARWTVSSLTESASDGVATSSPWPKLVLGLEPGQQRGQRDLAVDGLELRHRLHEQVEVVAPGGRRRARPTTRARRRCRQVSMIRRTRSRIGSPTAAAAGAARRPAARTAPAPPASRRSSPGRLEGVAERGDLGRVGTLDDRGVELGPDVGVDHPAAGPDRSPARRPSSARSRGPIAQRGPVSRVSSDGVGGDVLDQGQGGDHLGHLGQPEQALEADDLDRDLAPVSASNTSAAWELSRVSTPISRHEGSAIAAWAAVTCVGQGRELVVVGLVARPAVTSPGSAPGFGSSGRSSGRSA